MKATLLFLAILFTFTHPSSAEESALSKYLKNPLLDATESEKVLISIGFNLENNHYFFYRIYNGLRDKSIVGFIVAIYPEGTEAKDAKQEYQVSIDLPPLHTADGEGGQIFYPISQDRKPPAFKFAVKEIRYKSP